MLAFPPVAVANLPALAGVALHASRFVACGAPFFLRGKVEEPGTHEEDDDGAGNVLGAGNIMPQSAEKDITVVGQRGVGREQAPGERGNGLMYPRVPVLQLWLLSRELAVS